MTCMHSRSPRMVGIGRRGRRMAGMHHDATLVNLKLLWIQLVRHVRGMQLLPDLVNFRLTTLGCIMRRYRPREIPLRVHDYVGLWGRGIHTFRTPRKPDGVHHNSDPWVRHACVRQYAVNSRAI